MRRDWFSCDGGGRTEAGSRPQIMNRRQVLTAASLAAISWIGGARSALAQVVVNPSRESDEVIVVIFLRGGADGLNVVVPYREDAYYRLRPSLALAPPSKPSKDRVLDLDGFFAFHPAMAPLLPYFAEGHLAVVHACGSFDETRSHFDAMSAMERGLATASGEQTSGWLARYLDQPAAHSDSALRAIAFGDVLPDSLRGATAAMAMSSLDDFKLQVPGEFGGNFQRAIHEQYSKHNDAVSIAGRQTLRALEQLNELSLGAQKPGASYPNSDLGAALRQVSTLVKAGVGLEVACLDKGGWDTHVAQGGSTGWQSTLLDDLSKSLAAFAQDLGPKMARVTTVVMTEFGRRAYENSGLGTDHGRASFMLVLGSGVKGGRVHANWPGLEEHQLEGPGDLRVTTDYRDVLAELLIRKMGLTNVTGVFPGLRHQPVGIL